MRFSAVALAAGLLMVSGAALADDAMMNTYGNTVTTTNAKTGDVGKLMFNNDGTYGATGVGADGKPVSYTGKWAVTGTMLCLTPDVAQLPKSCSPVALHPVGDSWSVTNDQGVTYNVVLSAGR
jgi:hypothetical protein